jgi:hypothetical protein
MARRPRFLVMEIKIKEGITMEHRLLLASRQGARRLD